MNLSPELALYAQILFTIIFIALTGSVLALLRGIFGRAAAGLTARLLLPLSLLATTLLTKLAVLRNALPLGTKFFRIYDAAFVFIVIFLIVRLLEGLVLSRYEKK